MTHEIIKEKLLMADDPELSETERREIGAHLQSCSECSSRLAEWRKMQTVFAGARPLSASGPFVDQVMGRLARETGVREEAAAASAWTLPQWLFPALGYGLALLLMIIAIEHQQTSINTGAVLLSEVPQSSQWTFGQEPPDMNQLVGDPGEDV